jgi:hypothetical protein
MDPEKRLSLRSKLNNCEDEAEEEAEEEEKRGWRWPVNWFR